jgi:hypothetical protein
MIMAPAVKTLPGKTFDHPHLLCGRRAGGQWFNKAGR